MKRPGVEHQAVFYGASKDSPALQSSLAIMSQGALQKSAAMRRVLTAARACKKVSFHTEFVKKL
jgi:hypothetical protein